MDATLSDLVTPPQCNSTTASCSKQEVGIRQISNFPIKFLLMLMGAMPFGSISVCKLEEADEEEEEGVRRREVEGGQEEERKRGTPQLCLCLSLAGLPGSEATEAGLLLLASSGSLYKHSARRRIDNKHPQFLQNAKTASKSFGPLDLSKGQLFAFFQSCVQLARMAVASMAGGKLGRSGGRVGAAQARLLCLAPAACIGAGTTPPACLCPPTLPLLNNQPDRRSTRRGQPAMFVLARPLWPALFTCLPLAATRAQAQPALPVNKTILARGTLPLNKASQW